MKTLIITIVIVLFFAELDLSAQTKASQSSDSLLVKHISEMDFSKYENRKAKFFFRDIKNTYSRVKIWPVGSGSIKYFEFFYQDSLSLCVSVEGLGIHKRFESLDKYDFEKVKRKKINWICLKYSDQCIKGNCYGLGMRCKDW